MNETDITFRINNTVQGHTPQFEEIHFLPIFSRYGVVRVGQPDKGDLLISPVFFKGRGSIGPNCQDLSAALCELLISVPHTRQLRATVGSHKAAQEGEHDRLAAQV